MTSSLARMPHAIVEPTGNLNGVEIFKFVRLCAIWIGLIFTPVWLVCWAAGEFVPLLLNMAWPASDHPITQKVIELLQALVPILAVMVFIPINAMFMVLCERRALALFTVRKGPNRVGPDGLLQTLADAVKLLFKEDITPRGADALMFTLAPIIFFAPSIFGAMPLLAALTFDHPLFMTMELPTGIFFVLAMSAIPVVALVMGGWASNNKYSLVGGLRSAAQAISYEIPLVLSLITVCYMNHTLNVVDIGARQSVLTQTASDAIRTLQAIPDPAFTWASAGIYTLKKPDGTEVSITVPAAPMSPGFLQWNLFGNGVFIPPNFTWGNFFSNPEAVLKSIFGNIGNLLGCIALTICCFLLFGIYLTGACAEINRIPFDLPEAESELVSGYNTEYSGIKFAIFFLAEFTNLFIVATIATVMFLGGGSSPLPGLLDPWFFQQILSAIFANLGKLGASHELMSVLGSLLNPVTLSLWLWAVLKVYGIVIFAILVRGTLPRFRIDQLMDFSWKRLIPLTLIIFLAVAFLMEIVSRV